MHVKKVRFGAASDVIEFVRAATKCTHDVDVRFNHIVIDAKSLIGVMSISLGHILTVSYDEADSHLGHEIEQFAV